MSKVPVVTASFWVLKILTTGMGEAASDALVRWGGGVAIAVTAIALVASFVTQFRAQRYVSWLYWLAVAMVGVFGTMAADIPHFLGIPLWITSAGLPAAVLAIFAVWYRLEGTLSFASITRGRSEALLLGRRGRHVRPGHRGRRPDRRLLAPGQPRLRLPVLRAHRAARCWRAAAWV